MDITEIDKNLKYYVEIPDDVEWFNIRKEPFKIYGLLDYGDDGFRRLPDEITKPLREALFVLSKHSSGGRIRFKTNSPYIMIKAGFSGMSTFSNMPLINFAGFDVYENTETGSNFLCTLIPPSDMTTSYLSRGFIKGGKVRDITVNMPSYGAPTHILIGLQKGSVLEKTDGYKDIPPIIFYGSSITQGGCASRPGLIYENYICRRFNRDYINLGFSGNGQGDDAVVDYMASLDCSAFVSDYDHNAPDAEFLRKTHYKMYEKIRAAKPDIPYIMVSKPDYNNDPCADERRSIIIDSYIKARKNDKNVYFIDGKRLWNGPDRECCTVDGCHPNDLGMYRMAQTFIDEFEHIL